MATNIGPKIGIDGEAEYRKQINNLIQQAKTLKSEMNMVSSSFDENTRAGKRSRETSKVLTKEIEVQKERVKALSDMLAKSSQELGENDTRTLKWKEAVNDATAELNRMENELSDVQKQSSVFHKAMTTAEGGVKKLAKRLGGGLKDGLVNTAKAGAAALATLSATSAAMIVSLGKIGVEYNSQMESYETNFEVMLGSADEAKEKVESLKKLSSSTPFEMSGLADATQQLLAMGVASEDTNTYLQQLGDISLGDADKLNSLVGAFGKMNSTGKVSLEYINMMAEQGFNPLNVIAEQTGESMTQLYERVSKGKVSFEEIKNAMAVATSEGGQFYQGMQKASQTTEGMISTLKDNATALVGEVFKPISESLKNDILPMGIDAIDQLTTAFEEDGVEGMVTAAGNIIGEVLAEFTGSLPKFVNTAVDIVDSLMDGIQSNLDTIADGAVDTALALIDGLVDMLPDIIVTGALLIGKLAAGLAQAIPDLVMKIPDVIDALIEGFGENMGSFTEIGENIVEGLWKGIQNLAGWIGKKVSGFFSGLVDDAKNLLGIHSPSTVFAGIGGNMALGVGEGWDDEFDHVKSGISKTLDFDGVDLDHKMRIAPHAVSGMSSSNVNSKSYSYGDFSIQVYTQQGQDANAIANAVMDKIQTAVRRREAVFGA